MIKKFACCMLSLFLLFSPSATALAAPAIPEAQHFAATTSVQIASQAVPNAACQKLRTGQPIRVAILGDSNAAGTGTTPEHDWTFLFKTWLSAAYGSQVTLDNYAIGGTDSYTGYYLAETAMKTALTNAAPYDLLILCYGHNDDTETFALNYESLLYSVKKQNPSSQLITVLESSQQSYTDKMQTILDLSARYGADVADTILGFALSPLPSERLSDDGIHPNTEGHLIYFEMIGSILAKCVAENRPALPLPAPSSKAVTQPAQLERTQLPALTTLLEQLNQMPALQKKVTAIINSVTTPEMTPDEKLMACANYVINHCSYKRSLGTPSGTDWPAAYAEEMLRTGRGNCYRYASAIAYLAAGLGFEAQVCAGSVRSSKGGQTPHGWAEVRIGEEWYIFDGSMQDANKTGFFHITYENYPARRKPLIAEQCLRVQF